MASEHLLLLGDEACRVTVSRLVIAGWAGRDAAAVEEHIRELEELGVPRPTSTPVFYEVGSDCLTSGDSVDVLGPDSSGEAEVVLLAADGRLWVGVGSDHTDRAAERMGVALSKQLCPKPFGRAFWPMAGTLDRWDTLVLKSEISERGSTVTYQQGTVDSLLHPLDLVRKHTGSGTLPDGTVMFCGTLPVIGGIRPSGAFKASLHDPLTGRTLTHKYTANSLNVVS